jgi:hypothetical protein
VEIVIYAFTFYVGVVIVVALFGNDVRSKRAERVLRELLNVFKKIGTGR